MPRKTDGRAPSRTMRTCFNEAAARCRGKLDRLAEVAAVLGRASMRPRPDAAENDEIAARLNSALELQ